MDKKYSSVISCIVCGKDQKTHTGGMFIDTTHGIGAMRNPYFGEWLCSDTCFEKFKKMFEEEK